MRCGMMKVDVLALGMLTCIRKAFDLIATHEQVDIDLATRAARRLRRLRHALQGRCDRRVSGRKPRADEHAAASHAARISTISSSKWRSCGRAPSRATWCILICGAAAAREGRISRRHRRSIGPADELAECARQDDGRAAVPGAGDEACHRGGGLHAGRSQWPAARHGDVPQCRHHRQIPPQDDRRHGRGAAMRRDFAERCFKQIEGFGSYGFPESHAASFAHLVYISAWIKCHYPAVFACALLNSQPMGFYAPAEIVRDARDHGVEVRRRISISASGTTCSNRGRRTGACVSASARSMVSAKTRRKPSQTRGKRLSRRSTPSRGARNCRKRALVILAEADAFRSLGARSPRSLMGGAAPAQGRCACRCSRRAIRKNNRPKTSRHFPSCRSASMCSPITRCCACRCRGHLMQFLRGSVSRGRRDELRGNFANRRRQNAQAAPASC